MSHKETFETGTLKAIADILPLSSGIILSNDLPAPEDVGIIFWRAPLPSLHNYDTNIIIIYLFKLVQQITSVKSMLKFEIILSVLRDVM